MGFAATEHANRVTTTCDSRSTKEVKPIKPQSQLSRVEKERIEALKSKLKSLLAEHYGHTKHPDVLEVINELASLNPTKENCADLPQFLGDFFTLTSPNFPGRIKTGKDDLVQYTLGRLSFNIFQPNKLVCTLRGVRNIVEPQDVNNEKSDAPKRYSYPLLMDITIHTSDGDLPAILRNEAYCYESPDIKNRLMACFTGGTLMPAPEVKCDAQKLKLWASTFKGAYKKAEKERSTMGRMFQGMLKFSLGLTMPKDNCDHTFHFEIKRSPVGHLDVLFLDDDIRITKGNKGTIVVVERSR